VQASQASQAASVQSASRTFLSRVIPPDREGEVFSLYATTGRAAIWLSPLLYSAAIALSPEAETAAKTSWGILGILVVILAGLAVLLPIKPVRSAPGESWRTPPPDRFDIAPT
jgi:UMF1 family MFS transporter